MNKARHFLFLFLIVSVAFSFSACKKKAEFEPAPVSGTPSGGSEESVPPPSEERLTKEGPMTLDLFDEVNRQLQPVFFDFNMYDIREDQIPAMQNNARILKQN